MPVRILEESLVNKIAAGEVVERPASVAKELLENALDAGATELRVHLRAGGRNLVAVVDDGSGMDRTDALMALERHATSKIRTDADLFRVGTLGFRGEAVPSIASVSKLEIATRLRESDEGTRIVVEGGKLLDVSATGCAPGTEVRVGSLFFNVPARRKFLRSVDTELSHCVEAITRELLIRPEIDLEVTHDERVHLRCPRTADARRRAVDLLGAHGEALVPVSFRRGRLECDALVSPVGVHRQNAQGSSYLYVNGRFVRDLVLRRAIAQAYAGIVPKDRYPVVILRVGLPPEDVDVNVHPAKTEVRFLHAFELQNALAEGLRNALQDHGIHRPVASEARYRPPEDRGGEQVELLRSPAASSAPVGSPPPSPPPSSRASSPSSASSSSSPVSSSPPPPAPSPSATPAASPALAPRALLPVPRFADLHVLGQVARTYIVCAGGGELVLVDQHAAHERIRLVQLQRDPAGALGGSQRLLTPLVVNLGPARARAIAAASERLSASGLDLSDLGGGSVGVLGVPAPLSGRDLRAIVADMADDLVGGGDGHVPEGILDHVLATLACHTAVRANQELSVREMSAILAQLDEVDHAVCAHGRPVAVRIGSDELERRFHRS